MQGFRYYAIGHSYLKHGPFPGWQTEGFWGMAASAPEKDYFHRFQALLKEGFCRDVEAIAENHAKYERLCVEGVCEDVYKNSAEYAHIREVLCKFKPNVISLVIGGGNTPATDDASLSQFYDVLYALVAEYKQSETVVICPAIRKNIYRISKPIADKYGFLTVDVSYLHDVKGRSNPYYAYAEYPEYDAEAARGAVEFRTHPNDLGHGAIAESMLGVATSALLAIPEDSFRKEHLYEELIQEQRPECFHIVTEPQMSVSYFGFNIRQSEECVVFGSAPGTGASLVADKLSVSGEYNKLTAEMLIDGAAPNDTLTLDLVRGGISESYSLNIRAGMTPYVFSISDRVGEISEFRIAPSSTECVVSVKSVKLEK